METIKIERYSININDKEFRMPIPVVDISIESEKECMYPEMRAFWNWSGTLSIRGFDLKKFVYEMFFTGQKMGIEIQGLKWLGTIEGIFTGMQNNIMCCTLYLTKLQKVKLFVYRLYQKIKGNK